MSDVEPRYVLFHSEGCGSVFPLTILRLLNVPYELVVCDYEDATTHKKSPNSIRLVEANPLAQFPTLLTPEGCVMTEMTAIALYLQDRHGKDTPWDIHSLTPSQLAAFYRWFIFIPANLYPVIQASEFPARFVKVPADATIDPKTVESWVAKGTTAREEDLWKILERELTKDAPNDKFLLGADHPTFLDILVALVAHYTPRPRYAWFKENCPGLSKRVQATLQIEVIKDIFQGNKMNDFF